MIEQVTLGEGGGATQLASLKEKATPAEKKLLDALVKQASAVAQRVQGVASTVAKHTKKARTVNQPRRGRAKGQRRALMPKGKGKSMDVLALERHMEHRLQSTETKWMMSDIYTFRNYLSAGQASQSRVDSTTGYLRGNVKAAARLKCVDRQVKQRCSPSHCGDSRVGQRKKVYKVHLKKRYSSFCAYARTQGFCRTNKHIKGLCSKTCTNRGADDQRYSRPITKSLFQRKKFSSKCAHIKSQRRSGCRWFKNKCRKTCTGKGTDDPIYARPFTEKRMPIMGKKKLSFCAYEQEQKRGCIYDRIRTLCKKTCGLCPRCAYYKSKGFCHHRRHSRWMRENCAAHCKAGIHQKTSHSRTGRSLLLRLSRSKSHRRRRRVTRRRGVTSKTHRGRSSQKSARQHRIACIRKQTRMCRKKLRFGQQYRCVENSGFVSGAGRMTHNKTATYDRWSSGILKYKKIVCNLKRKGKWLSTWLTKKEQAQCLAMQDRSGRPIPGLVDDAWSNATYTPGCRRTKASLDSDLGDGDQIGYKSSQGRRYQVDSGNQWMAEFRKCTRPHISCNATDVQKACGRLANLAEFPCGGWS